MTRTNDCLRTELESSPANRHGEIFACSKHVHRTEHIVNLFHFLALHVVWGKRMLPTRNVCVCSLESMPWAWILGLSAIAIELHGGVSFATVRCGQFDGVFFLVDQPMFAPRRRRRYFAGGC